MTRSVWRKRVKVIGVLLSLLMLGLWVFSVMFVSFYEPPSGEWQFGIAFGRIGFDSALAFYLPGWRIARVSDLFLIPADLPWTEFAHSYLGFGLPGKNGLPNGMPNVPVWLLVVTVGLPTAMLWWRDRRPTAGFCTVCKYDLTGNVSGTCPECGTEYAKLSHAQ